MDKPPNARQSAAADTPNESKVPKIVRAVGLGTLVLVLWFGDKVAVGHLPAGSAWRYVIGAVIVAVGLFAVISISERFAEKNT